MLFQFTPSIYNDANCNLQFYTTEKVDRLSLATQDKFIPYRDNIAYSHQ